MCKHAYTHAYTSHTQFLKENKNVQKESGFGVPWEKHALVTGEMEGGGGGKRLINNLTNWLPEHKKLKQQQVKGDEAGTR